MIIFQMTIKVELNDVVDVAKEEYIAWFCAPTR